MKNTFKTELIENYLTENNLSKTKFCKICGISPSTLQRIMAKTEGAYSAERHKSSASTRAVGECFCVCK